MDEPDDSQTPTPTERKLEAQLQNGSQAHTSDLDSILNSMSSSLNDLYASFGEWKRAWRPDDDTLRDKALTDVRTQTSEIESVVPDTVRVYASPPPVNVLLSSIGEQKEMSRAVRALQTQAKAHKAEMNERRSGLKKWVEQDVKRIVRESLRYVVNG
jgi:hypothetical protein